MLALRRPTLSVRLPSPASYALLALLLGAVLIVLLITREARAWCLLAGALAPDATLFLGIAPGLAKGQIHPRAVPLYNALHRVLGPVVLAAAALLWLGLPWLVAALAWGAHIALDRSLGIGLRTRDGFIRE
jgi:hypothetical protein